MSQDWYGYGGFHPHTHSYYPLKDDKHWDHRGRDSPTPYANWCSWGNRWNNPGAEPAKSRLGFHTAVARSRDTCERNYAKERIDPYFWRY
jgi:hypothetical protein